MRTTTEWVVQEKDRKTGKCWHDAHEFDSQEKAIRHAAVLEARFAASWQHRVVIRVEVVVWEGEK